MKAERESKSNLIHMHITGTINVEEIVQMFIRENPRKLHWFLVKYRNSR